MASLSKIKVGTTEYDLKATYDSNGNQIVDTYVLKKGDTMTGTLNVPTINNYNTSTAVSMATGTHADSYFQSRKFRGEGNAGTYYHAIDFGYAGHSQVDFYEYGGIWNFWMNNQSTAVTDKATKLALTIGLNSLSNKSYTYTWPNKTGTFALTSDLSSYATTAALNEEATRAKAKESELETAISEAGKIDDVQVNGTSVVTDKVANVDLSNYVTLDGEQTITGKKKFTDATKIHAAGASGAGITLYPGTKTGSWAYVEVGQITGSGTTRYYDGRVEFLNHSGSDPHTLNFPCTKDGTLAITDDIVQSDWSVTDESSKAYIKNKPTIPAAVTVDSALSSTSTNPVQNKIINSALAGKQSTLSSTNKLSTDCISGLATVATTGKYSDLTGTPTIPAAVTVDSALSDSSTNPVQNKVIKAALDGKQAAGSYAAASHTHTKSQITDFPTIPTKTSQLTNDSGYMTTIKAASGSNIGVVGTPSVSATTTGTTTTFTFDYLKGEKGEKGDKGDAGASGAPTYQPSTWSLIFS